MKEKKKKKIRFEGNLEGSNLQKRQTLINHEIFAKKKKKIPRNIPFIARN